MKIQNICLSLSLIWVACGIFLTSCIPMRSLPFAHFLIYTARSLNGSLSNHVLVNVAGYFALPAVITAMVSVKRSMRTFLLTWWEAAATWQLIFRSPPSLCLHKNLSLLGLQNCSKSWNFHSPGRRPPAEWVANSRAPCWAPSSTATEFLGGIFFYIIQFLRVNRRP